jgi:hypothetical protein
MNQGTMEYDAKQVYFIKEMKFSQFNFVRLSFIIFFSALSSSLADYWIFCGPPLPLTVTAVPFTFSFLCRCVHFSFCLLPSYRPHDRHRKQLVLCRPIRVKVSSRGVLEIHSITRLEDVVV